MSDRDSPAQSDPDDGSAMWLYEILGGQSENWLSEDAEFRESYRAIASRMKTQSDDGQPND